MNRNMVKKPKKEEFFDDEDDDVVESSSSKSSDESKTKMFKLMIIITCVTAGLLLVLYIASFFTNKAYTYNDLENIMKNASIEYFNAHSEYLPKEEGKIVQVDVANLVYEGRMKDLSEYGVGCTGYVLVEMIMTDEAWFVVRNTPGVTGFVGPGSKPVPLTEEEMMPLGIQKPDIEVDFAEGDMVVVTGGAWKDTAGVITGINMQKQTVTINVELFGRETPVEISFTEIKKAE